MCLPHHKDARRAEKPLQGKLLPEARGRFLVTPVDMPFPRAAGSGIMQHGLHVQLQQAAVRADKKTESGVGHGVKG